MRLFKPDLYKNFAIGFAVGAGIVAWQIAPEMASDRLIPQAHAATAGAPSASAPSK